MGWIVQMRFAPRLSPDTVPILRGEGFPGAKHIFYYI